MRSRFTSTRSKYIVKYFFSSVSTFDLSYTHGNRVARQLKIFATVHRIKRRIIVLIPPRIITPLWIRLTRLFPFNDYFSAPIFVTDEIGCEATSSCLRRTATWMNVWRRWGWELVTIEPIAKERAIRVIIPLQIAFPSRCIFEFSEAIVISVALADAPAFRVK